MRGTPMRGIPIRGTPMRGTPMRGTPYEVTLVRAYEMHDSVMHAYEGARL